MALKVYVISHSATGAVLAALSARDGIDTTQLLASVVGTALPISVAPPRIAPPTTPFSIDASKLRVDEATSEDPTSLDPNSVLFAPWQYVAAIDANTNKFQSLSRGSAFVGNAPPAPNVIELQLPGSIAPSISVPGWLQLFASGPGTVQASYPLTFTTTATSYSNVVQSTFTPFPGADTALILVKGCTTYVGAFPLS
ncbi:MAG TPA: hypothetical protein VGG28_27355 [Kofleriaceae bacterium]|jgi:hypothetical protein